jgi:hypothetical protein
MKLISFIFPTYWAPALINNDWSGLFEDEIERIKAAVGNEGLHVAACVDCEEIGFRRYIDDMGTMGCLCSSYRFLVD